MDTNDKDAATKTEKVMGYEPGTILHSRTGKYYRIMEDGSWRRCTVTEKLEDGKVRVELMQKKEKE